jgi:hypothetical protein
MNFSASFFSSFWFSFSNSFSAGFCASFLSSFWTSFWTSFLASSLRSFRRYFPANFRTNFVQLAGRILLQLMAQLRQVAPLPAFLLAPCSLLLLLILCHGGVFLSRAHARTTIYNTQG